MSNLEPILTLVIDDKNRREFIEDPDRFLSNVGLGYLREERDVALLSNLDYEELTAVIRLQHSKDYNADINVGVIF